MSQQPSGEYVSARAFVRWGDCDPAGITFYPRFFEWMDMTSHVLTRELGISREDRLPPRLLGFPLVKVQAEFLSPAVLYDELEIRVWVTRLGRTSLGLRHEIHRLNGQPALLAHGREERVHIGRDSDGAMRPRELTPAMREVLQRYLDSGSEPGDPGATIT